MDAWFYIFIPFIVTLGILASAGLLARVALERALPSKIPKKIPKKNPRKTLRKSRYQILSV